MTRNPHRKLWTTVAATAGALALIAAPSLAAERPVSRRGSSAVKSGFVKVESHTRGHGGTVTRTVGTSRSHTSHTRSHGSAHTGSSRSGFHFGVSVSKGHATHSPRHGSHGSYGRPGHYGTHHRPPVVVHRPPVVVHKPHPVPVVKHYPRHGSHHGTVCDSPYGAHRQNGWYWLDNDRFGNAIRAFEYQANRDPYNATPKIGYALANALAGNDSRAVFAMKRAVYRDPYALKRLSLNHHLKRHVRELIARYSHRHRGCGCSHSDRKFMVAALSVIVHDYHTAHDAINQAFHYSRDIYTVKLRNMILHCVGH